MIKGILKRFDAAVPEIIGALVAEIIILSASWLARNVGLWLSLSVAVGGTLWILCVYVLLKHKTQRTRIKKGRYRTQRIWRYPHQRLYALAGVILIPALVAGWFFYKDYESRQPPDKIIVLVADIEGPDQQGYRFTEFILRKLNLALVEYKDVEIRPLARAIKESEGSKEAVAIGRMNKAALVIWGWYGKTPEQAPVSLNFEMLRGQAELEFLGPQIQNDIQTVSMEMLDSVRLQPKLATETAYITLFTVGLIRAAAFDYDKAIASFDEALRQTDEQFPALDRSEVYLYRGDMYQRKGQLDRAAQDYAEAERIAPRNPRVYIRKGSLYFESADSRHALEAFQQAVDLDPNSVSAYLGKSGVYLLMEDYAQAAQACNKLTELQPDSSGAYSQCGVIHARNGENDLAQSYYRQALVLAQQVVRQQAYSSEAWNRLGAIQLNMGDAGSAIAAFKRATNLQPERGLYHNNLGMAYAAQKDYAKARESFSAAIYSKNTQDVALAYSNRAALEMIQGLQATLQGLSGTAHFDRAISDLTSAISLQPNLTTYSERGTLYLLRSDYANALLDADRVLRIDPDNLDGWLLKASAHAYLKQEAVMRQDIEQMLARAPNDARTYVAMGILDLLQGKRDSAIARFNEALGLSQGPFLQLQIQKSMSVFSK
ncbi:MAG: tetratricopeptide repeat protein [Chloroflexi bacterium]|nr:tetratricopeptide repeat protein [Chloroflexota bacterium]